MSFNPFILYIKKQKWVHCKKKMISIFFNLNSNLFILRLLFNFFLKLTVRYGIKESELMCGKGGRKTTFSIIQVLFGDGEEIKNKIINHHQGYQSIFSKALQNSMFTPP